MQTIISANSTIVNLLRAEQPQNLEIYKPSKFNYYVKSKRGYVVYNTLCNSLHKFTFLEYEKILGKRKCGLALKKKLVKEGIIVDPKFDELNSFLSWAEKNRNLEKSFVSFNITTTMKCNARCEYCYEQSSEKFDYDVNKIQSLINFIKKKSNNSKKVAITWFGGEPLLNMTLIDLVSNQLKNDGIDFTSYIITNGSLLSPQIINDKFPLWNVKDVQITLDGLADTYLSRKQYIDSQENVFEKILDYILLMGQSSVNVHIRLNIDHNNMDEMLELIKLLDSKFGDITSVSWYPAFITGIGDKFTEREKSIYLKTMFSCLKDPSKMNISNRLYKLPKSSPCMRNDPCSYTIDTDENIFICEHLVGQPGKCIGNLNNFSKEVNEKRTRLEFRNECKKCVFLPKCMGGCYVNLETNDSPCMIEKYMIKGYLSFLAEKFW